MRNRGLSSAVLVACLLIASVVLTACPKRPEVSQAGAGVVGPSAGALPSTTSDAAAAAAPAQAGAEGGPAGSVAAGIAPTVAVEPRASDASSTSSTAPESPATSEAKASPAAAASGPLADVFFDFDKSNIREDQRAALAEAAAWLKAGGRRAVTIEGHADERGTSEYNLALGERRAKAVKDYLVAAGLAADRMTIVSYGEERPFVLGHDESAWKWNRRGHFVVTAE